MKRNILNDENEFSLMIMHFEKGEGNYIIPSMEGTAAALVNHNGESIR